MFLKKRKILYTKKAQGMVEYALLLGLLSLMVVTAMTIMGTDINEVFQVFANKTNEVSNNISQ